MLRDRTPWHEMRNVCHSGVQRCSYSLARRQTSRWQLYVTLIFNEVYDESHPWSLPDESIYAILHPNGTIGVYALDTGSNAEIDNF
jgi:hypothetical protein